MAAALKQLGNQGIKASLANAARLSPLVYKHINFQGRYAFGPGRVGRAGRLASLAGSTGAGCVAWPIPVFRSIATHTPRPKEQMYIF